MRDKSTTRKREEAEEEDDRPRSKTVKKVAKKPKESDDEILRGFYTEEDDADDAYARILVTGPPKVGKTVTLVTTSPPPVVVLNCDLEGALSAARRFKGKFMAKDINSAKDWDNATRDVVKYAAKGQIRTCIVDTLTVLVGNTLAREMNREYQGFEIWRQTQDCVMTGLNRLMRAECHLFVVAHITKDEAAGLLPDVPGSLQRLVPALLHDWVSLSYDAKRDPERAFLVGPQENWSRSGRHVKRSTVVEADVEALLEELDIAI